MAGNIVTALVAKLEDLFGAPGPGGQTLLVYRIPGVPINTDEVVFDLKELPNSQVQLDRASDFARLVNQIPGPGQIWSSDGRLLWNEYATVLTQAVVASDEATEGEKARLQRARDVIYRSVEVTDQSGVHVVIVDSPGYAEYKRYQDAYFQLLTEYNSRRMTAENSTDPEVQRDWRLGKSQWDTRVKAALSDWVIKGHKTEIEDAFATIDQITGRSPQMIWSEWKDNFRRSKLTDLRDQEFYLTYFSPAGSLNDDNTWMRFSLDESEINNVQAWGSRHTALNSILAAATVEEEPEISTLEVELKRVVIERPWLDARVFSSRYWDWADARPLLCDGRTSPQGSLTAYPVEIILARNLTATMKSAANGEGKSIVPAAQQPASLGPFQLEVHADRLASGSMGFSGVQIIAFVCHRLPKAPDPDPNLSWTGPVSLKWLGGTYRLERSARISQVKVTIHTGDVDFAGTDANVDFRINNGAWRRLDKSFYDDFERNATDTYGPYDVENLTVEDLERVPVEIKHDNFGAGSGWYVESLRLEVYVAGQGWLAYREWKPGWLAGDEGDGSIYRRLQ